MRDRTGSTGSKTGNTRPRATDVARFVMIKWVILILDPLKCSAMSVELNMSFFSGWFWSKCAEIYLSIR